VVQKCVALVSVDQAPQANFDSSNVMVECAGPGLSWGVVGLKAGNIDVSFSIEHGHVVLVQTLENQPLRRSRIDSNVPQKPSAPPQNPSRNSSTISRFVAASTRIPLDAIHIAMADPSGCRVDSLVSEFISCNR
jgi:hypothetical protein